MVVIRQAEQAADSLFRQLIEERMLTMADGEDFDSDIHGYFLVMEPGDCLAELEQEVGPVDMVEVIEEHVAFFEAVFIPGSGDFGIVVLVPKTSSINPELLSFCQSHAVPSP